MNSYAVRNTHTGSTVGMYTKEKAEGLAKEWNELAMRARQVAPYVVIEFQECEKELAHPQTVANDKDTLHE